MTVSFHCPHPIGSDREAATLALLHKFQQRLQGAKSARDEEQPEEEADRDDSWLGHALKFEEAAPVLARDANTKGDDWFEIFDPRNPLNQRRRQESKKIMKEKVGKTKADL